MGRIKAWEELTIQDNFLFQKVMRNKRICKYLIERILHIRIKEITFPDYEKTIAVRYDSKSIRLDVYVEDEQGRVFDIEMQCSNGAEGELPKRARYYQAMIDMDLLEKGQSYKKLNPAFIIFICTFDPFDKGLPLYTFRNQCMEEDNLTLGDETTKLFLNSKGQSDTLDPDIAAFLRYVDGNAPSGEFAKEVDEEVVRVKKHDETRREYMKYAMELKEAREEGREENSRLVILNLFELHMPVDFIAKAVGQTPQHVQQVIDRMQIGRA